MASVNVTIDDFDPLITYSNYADWQTPNPQDHPDWWNASSEVTGVPWHQATYHQTSVQGAKASLNFTATSLTIYGAAGEGSNYTIILDPSLPQPFSQSYSTPNATDGGRTVLYSTNELTFAPHQLEIVNYGSELLLDLIVIGLDLGAEGATLTNTTVEDNDDRVTYNGDFTTQDGEFHGGTSTYTQGPGNAWAFSFEGSAIYIYGDQVNDHGLYSIYVNGSSTPYGTYNGRSGCGDASYAKECEKLHGLIGYIGGLPQGTHNVTLVNGGPAEGNRTFVDFDYLDYTVPSSWSPQQLESAECPFTTCVAPSGSSSDRASATVSGGASQTSSSPGASNTGAALERIGSGSGMLAMVLGAWLLKKLI